MSGAGLTLPATGGGISDGTAAFAAELIDRSGKAPAIEAALARATGRPRPLPVPRRAHRPAVPGPGRPAAVPHRGHPAAVPAVSRLRRLLGVPGTATTERAFLAACRRVRYCFGAICPAMDPSALPKNRRLSQATSRPVPGR